MANELHSPTDQQSMTTLVTGIINDAQELFQQQLALTRREIQDDLRKTRDALVSLAVGAGVAALACILLGMALAHLLDWLWPELPLWGGFAIVGGVLAVAGGALLYLGIHKFQSFNPLPDESAQALRENVQWLRNPTTPR